MTTPILGPLIVAAIVAVLGYVFNLEKRIGELKAVKTEVGETRLPKTSETEDFWNEKRGGGWRKTIVRVEFKETFVKAPRVMIGLTRFDLGDFKSSIHRIGVRAHNPTVKGFDLYFETWNESLIYEAEVTWMAIAQ